MIEENDGALHSSCRGLDENSNVDAVTDRNREAFVVASRSDAAQIFLLRKASQPVNHELSSILITAKKTKAGMTAGLLLAGSNAIPIA